MISPLSIDAKRGTLPGQTPYIQTGTGNRILIVLPGVGDALFRGTYPPLSRWALASYFARYDRTYSIYLLSRPRGLPAGYDSDDAVETHSQAIEAIADSQTEVDVIGISMGGLIGQELAYRRPDLIDRLVLANSACRLNEDARPAVRYLETLARKHDWFSIRSELARSMFTDARAITYPPLIQTVGRFVLPRPEEPSDVWRSLQFIRDFDSREYLEEVEQPTLVFAGERDPYFTSDVTSETVSQLPRGQLTSVETGKHGAFQERKFLFDSVVTSFLEQ